MITKAGIISFVNEALKLEELATSTAYDIALQTCLNDLSNCNLLPAEDISQSLVLEGKTLNYPTAFKQLISIVLNDGSYDGKPLKLIPGGMSEYGRLMQNYSSNGVGEPTHQTEFNKKFYIYPPADGAYTAKIKHYKFHAQSITTIEFGDEFANAINLGTAYFKAVLTNRPVETVTKYSQLYYAEREIRRLEMPTEPQIVGE
ncbi:MAG: hypothetical protein PHH26_00675 [Candidatus Thermoplasmatota archaeon]|nr:hypothetical protein [Candidatus Thermoplasmatota archaeon]